MEAVGDFSSEYNQKITLLVEAHQQTEEMFTKKERLRRSLQKLIRKKYPQASVYFTGSTWSGFGTDFSDIDLCIMVPACSESNTEGLAYRNRIMQFLSNYVKEIVMENMDVEVIVPILARIPILKFLDPNTGLICDVSFNSTNAVRNTHLLKLYAHLDDRVVPLVVAVKAWAKEFGINDAKEGTLSSYALTIMCLYYLWCGCYPPVVHSVPLFFFDNCVPISELVLTKPWKTLKMKRGKKPLVGELLRGFFKFYAEFSWEEETICLYPHSLDSVNAVRKNIRKGEWRNDFIRVIDAFEFYNAARSVSDVFNFKKIKEQFKVAHLQLKYASTYGTGESTCSSTKKKTKGRKKILEMQKQEKERQLRFRLQRHAMHLHQIQQLQLQQHYQQQHKHEHEQKPHKHELYQAHHHENHEEEYYQETGDDGIPESVEQPDELSEVQSCGNEGENEAQGDICQVVKPGEHGELETEEIVENKVEDDNG